MSEWWKISPACQSCDEYEDCDVPCAMAMSFLQNDTYYDK